MRIVVPSILLGACTEDVNLEPPPFNPDAVIGAAGGEFCHVHPARAIDLDDHPAADPEVVAALLEATPVEGTLTVEQGPAGPLDLHLDDLTLVEAVNEVEYEYAAEPTELCVPGRYYHARFTATVESPWLTGERFPISVVWDDLDDPNGHWWVESGSDAAVRPTLLLAEAAVDWVNEVFAGSAGCSWTGPAPVEPYYLNFPLQDDLRRWPSSAGAVEFDYDCGGGYFARWDTP